MKNTFAWRLAASAILFSILACSALAGGDRAAGGSTIYGSGNLVSENRNVSGISGVQLTMSGTLHITMGNSDSLRVEAEDNLQPYIRTEVTGGTLVIETRPGFQLENTRPIDYFLTVRQLSAIALSSSGDARAENLQAGAFSVEISSSGNVTIGRLEADSIRVRISSSGELTVQSGRVQTQTISLSSSGEYSARDLQSANADVSLSSSGGATIRVSDHLTGSLSSSGNVYYIGNPDVRVSKSSSGKAVQLDGGG